MDTASGAAGPGPAARLQPVPCEREGDEGRDHPASHPAGRGWVPLSRDLGIPGEHGSEGPAAALGCSAVFTRELRVRFLDHLAFKGNARAAAARVGVSHETAYRKRRQDAAFAALWDAALVHARHYSESQLATRALDGVEVPVWHRGEIVGFQVKHDTRLLLAHLARLDRRVEADTAAQARAGRFDELLADYAGHEVPEGFADAAREALDWRERRTAPELPPTRQAYVNWCRSKKIGGRSEKTGARAMPVAGEAAGSAWDAWHRGALARVGSIVEENGDGDSVDPHRTPSVGCANTSPVNGGGSGSANPPPSNPPLFTGEVPSAAKAEGATEAPPAPSNPPPLAEEASAPSNPPPFTEEAPASSDPPPFTGEVPKAEGAPVRSHAANEEGGPAESDEDDAGNLPYEIKSAGAMTRPISAPQDRVTGVNPPRQLRG